MMDVDHLRKLYRRLDSVIGEKLDGISVFASQETHDQVNAECRRLRAAWQKKYPGAERAIDNALIRTGYVG